jgi:hypothetical protein
MDVERTAPARSFCDEEHTGSVVVDNDPSGPSCYRPGIELDSLRHQVRTRMNSSPTDEHD